MRLSRFQVKKEQIQAECFPDVSCLAFVICSENHTDTVTAMINGFGLYPENCQGQAYYNADNMSGRLNSLQAHFNIKSPIIQSTAGTARCLGLVVAEKAERADAL